MVVDFTEHLFNGIQVPNIIVYVFTILVLSLLFALVVSKDMSEEEDCFDEKVQAKISAFNAATSVHEDEDEDNEEPTKEQVEELYKMAAAGADSDESSEDEVNLPDILLIVRAKYRDAENLLTFNGKADQNQLIEVQDVKFLDFYPSLYTNIPQNLKKIRRNSL